eukprot:5799554-Pleurochrysis_carterae.AAC.1
MALIRPFFNLFFHTFDICSSGAQELLATIISRTNIAHLARACVRPSSLTSSVCDFLLSGEPTAADGRTVAD